MVVLPAFVRQEFYSNGNRRLPLCTLHGSLRPFCWLPFRNQNMCAIMRPMGPGSPKRPKGKRAIFRLPKVEQYFCVDNGLFSDGRLSWEARGLMGYLLSKPDDWRVRIYDIVARGPAGREKIRRMLFELMEGGYLNRRRIALPNGRFEWETQVYEAPEINPRAER